MNEPTRLVVLGDHPANLPTLSHILRELPPPFEILTTKSDAEALEMINQHLIHVLVVVRQQFVPDGLEFIQAARLRAPKMRIVMIYLNQQPKELGYFKDILEKQSDLELHLISRTSQRIIRFQSGWRILETIESVGRSPSSDPGEGSGHEMTRWAEQLEQLRNYIVLIEHEFRTSIGIQQGYADLLHNEALGSLNPGQRKAIDAILRSSMGLRKLVERLSSLLSLQTDELIPLPVSLDELIEDTISEYSNRAQSVGVKFQANLIDRSVTVYGDALLLRQAITNILENAVKFTPPGGDVTIRLERENDTVKLVIEDSGIGIDTNQFNNVFQPFNRINKFTTGRRGEVGIGLALTKAIIEAHGGQVQVLPIGREGAAFQLSVPTVPKSAQLPSFPSRPAAHRH